MGAAFLCTVLGGGLGCLFGMAIGLPELGSVVAIAIMGVFILEEVQEQKKSDGKAGPDVKKEHTEE